MNEPNRRCLLDEATSAFWLDASAQQIADRLRKRDGEFPVVAPTPDDRQSLEQRVAYLLAERVEVYRQFVRVDASPRTDLVVGDIVSQLVDKTA